MDQMREQEEKRRFIGAVATAGKRLDTA